MGELEPLEPYFRERARAERAIAGEAGSPEARKAHLELAVRYVKVAEALYVSNRGEMDGQSSSEIRATTVTSPADLRPALRSAFPLPDSGAFLDLLQVID